MSRIKNIIFDLGGVIINIDYKKTEQAFVNLGVTNFRELYSQFHTTHIFEELEKGNLTAEEFLDEVKKITPIPLKSDDIVIAWNAMLLDLPAGRLKFLYAIKENYRSFLLSNTNEIHYEAIQQRYRQQMEAEHRLEDCFEKAYYSHELHLRKPEPEIFLFVLKKNNLAAEETLFIDDTKANVDGALEAGLQGIYLGDGQQLEEIFSGNYLAI